MSLSLSEQMQSNGFFPPSLDRDQVRQRVWELEQGKVGFYSVGLYPASLAYNCAMQQRDEDNLLLSSTGTRSARCLSPIRPRRNGSSTCGDR